MSSSRGPVEGLITDYMERERAGEDPDPEVYMKALQLAPVDSEYVTDLVERMEAGDESVKERAREIDQESSYDGEVNSADLFRRLSESSISVRSMLGEKIGAGEDGR